MSVRVPKRRDGADRPLAGTFRRNAAGFHEAAEAALDRHPEVTCYFLAIAIELALKAHLLHRGISDDWNRVHIRHDLIKALRCAQRAGFNGAPVGLHELATLLGPYYKAHAISELPPEAIGSVGWSEAYATVRDLLAAVGAAIDRDGPDAGPRPMHEEGG